ncbi:peroxidase family protein [Nitrosomonas sp. Nm166]|uniref:peroxidase family protein n=1 Tax=Nitrosomonas sp. Nm166 TaxID=1881054 RepID=UPI0008EAC4A9|nr:peroxidase family protein [Nitrosomonas sp. Nm166]SFE15424.1 Ca2+-binding protein, RTX toxin-related [Nitrosomonas sp. Nm166]
MANLSRSDLDFLIQQVVIAEQDSVAQKNGNFTALPGLVGSALLPDGLRNVDGSYNNLLPGHRFFGAADQVFPRLLKPVFRDADRVVFDVDGPSGQSVGDPTSYAQTSGAVFDSQPRTISNLIVDQTDNNPAAIAAAAQTDGSVADVDGKGTFFIPNVTPDAGLSAPYNAWFTFFGQFFDHGLDLVNKGGSGTIFVPLKPDDPLVTHGPNGIAGDGDEVQSQNAFMPLTRATNLPGPNGILGDSDDIHEHVNQTTPFVDQNQTYTSHPSHQVFLREYALNGAGDPVSTGRLLDGSGGRGGLATWSDIKLQAKNLLGINLTDADVTNLPQIKTDSYGKFTPGPNGFPQLVLNGGGTLEGNPAAPVNIPGNVVRTGHAFLDDIAHAAVPRNLNGTMKQPDSDSGVGLSESIAYDDELLDRHFATGDGRGNENIGLTTVHTVFHAEHNRTVDFIKDLVDSSSDNAFKAQWHLSGGAWDGERLFQAARFATEMQYQHLVFEEFARKVQPNVDVFVGYNSTINPAIMAEFAHVVYRFGHSLLTETVARTDMNPATGKLTPNDVSLIQAFLNPVEFGAGYANNLEAAAAVVRGTTKQVGNELDEFVTDALRNNLLGLPLDLPTINLTRGRDTGIPPLNEARRMFYEDTGQHASLQPYESWADFGQNLRHPESLTNFIAAYGTHPSITSETTFAGKRAAAQALVDQAENDNNSNGAVDFINSTGGVTAGSSGLNAVDFWIGGLAEKQAPFGGLLGSTFNFVFETQMEKLQDGDRFYYLARTAGLDFLTQLEENSFAEMVMLNLPGVKHLPFDIFSTPAYIFEVGNLGDSGPIKDDPDTLDVNEATLRNHLGKLALVRDTTLGPNTIRYTGDQHVVMGGTNDVNRIRASEGDDTIWGDGGNDRLEGGAGNDSINGGDGNDIITDSFGDDNVKGGEGHDVINGGPGVNLLLGGGGSDFIVTGSDISEVFGGPGNDFIFGNTPNEVMMGNEGDDWIETGTADGAPGDNFDPFNRDPIRGNDVFLGNGGIDEFLGEGGDDLMNGKAGFDKNDGSSGFDWVFNKGSIVAANVDLAKPIPQDDRVPPDLLDRYDFVEAASGWNLDDVVRGDSRTNLELEFVDPLTGQNNALDNVNNPASGGHSAADRIALIDGLSTLLGGATTFSAGNILLGGAGSDLIEGRGGDDIIDGDAWLNVRISVRDANDSSIEIASFENMTGSLRTAMQSGTYRPDQLRIVREIVTAPAGNDIDTAVFRDVYANYVVTFGSDGTIFVDHVNPGNGGGGIDDGSDTVRNVERLQFADRTLIVGGGNTVGTPGDDNLVGTDGDDELSGFAGNDKLDGLGGVDTLIGGPDNDTYVVDTTTDILTELAGEGIDTVESSVTFKLGSTSNLENLTLTGTAAINGTGNAADNILIGNSNNNVLTSNAGNDTLMGGDGNDKLSGGAGNDTLTGGNGNDRLVGGTGDDSMDGGADNDSYVIDSATDTITELPGGGTDTVESSISFMLDATSNLENLKLTGTALIDGTGNDENNVLTGNGKNNVLSGGGGDDDLLGKSGADTLTGGAGADDFIYTLTNHSTPGATGRDTITDFTSGIDHIDLSAIDADTGVAGDQAFTFIGEAVFSAAGQVRYVSATGVLQANVGGANGNAADFQINLTGAPAFDAVTDLIV